MGDFTFWAILEWGDSRVGDFEFFFNGMGDIVVSLGDFTFWAILQFGQFWSGLFWSGQF